MILKQNIFHDLGRASGSACARLLKMCRQQTSTGSRGDCQHMLIALQVAGNADAFRKVDLVYVKKAAKTAKAAGVQHFSLVTAQTSNSKQWASDWLPFHPLLYIKVKGQVTETAVCLSLLMKRASQIGSRLLNAMGAESG